MILSEKGNTLMKASELLTALTLPQKCKPTKESLRKSAKRLPITQIRQEERGLVFALFPGKPLAMKDYWLFDDPSPPVPLFETKTGQQPIYSFKEQDDQIIL